MIFIKLLIGFIFSIFFLKFRKINKNFTIFESFLVTKKFCCLLDQTMERRLVVADKSGLVLVEEDETSSRVDA